MSTLLAILGGVPRPLDPVRSLLRLRRQAVDHDGAVSFVFIDFQVARSGIDTARLAMSTLVPTLAFNRFNLRRLYLRLRQLDPAGDLFRPLQCRQLSTPSVRRQLRLGLGPSQMSRSEIAAHGLFCGVERHMAGV